MRIAASIGLMNSPPMTVATTSEARLNLRAQGSTASFLKYGTQKCASDIWAVWEVVPTPTVSPDD